MAAWLDNCKFTPTAGGTANWVFSAALTGYSTPAQAVAVNGSTYTQFAISADSSQWEIAKGNYNSGTNTFSRTTVLYNSSGTGANQGGSGSNLINFSAAPSVAIVATAEDLNNLAGTATVAYRYNATAGQTTFSGADLNSLTLQYTVGSLFVFLNGALQTNGVDYTATNGSSAVFASGLSLGDEVIIVAFSSSTVAAFNTATQYQFTATGAQTVFTGADVNGATLATNGFFTLVHQNGRLLSPTADYTLTGTTLTLLNGANVGDAIGIVNIATNNLTSTTQAALDNSTNMATTAYVDRLYESPSNLGLNTTQKQNALAQIGAAPAITSLTASLGADVTLNNTSTYFDGPSVAQGTSGTWLASGTVLMAESTSANASFSVKLWDGTTVIASGEVTANVVGSIATVSLSGVISTPAGNIRISVKDVSNTTGKILSNASGNSKDSTITAVRLA